jgi:hypothetical protein
MSNDFLMGLAMFTSNLIKPLQYFLSLFSLLHLHMQQVTKLGTIMQHAFQIFHVIFRKVFFDDL